MFGEQTFWKIAFSYIIYIWDSHPTPNCDRFYFHYSLCVCVILLLNRGRMIQTHSSYLQIVTKLCTFGRPDDGQPSLSAKVFKNRHSGKRKLDMPRVTDS